MMSRLAERFRERAEQSQSQVHDLAGWPAVIGLALSLVGDERVAVSPALASEVPEIVELLADRAHLPDADDPARSVADAAVGLVRGELAVAESGSVLVAENELVDRVVSMLSRTVVQVVDRERVVGSLDDVAHWLAERGSTAGYSALVTGPSRTADIERSLTIGVQGPAAVHVVVLG